MRKGKRKTETKVALSTYVLLRSEHVLRCLPFKRWATKHKFPPATVAEWDKKWAEFEALG